MKYRLIAYFYALIVDSHLTRRLQAPDQRAAVAACTLYEPRAVRAHIVYCRAAAADSSEKQVIAVSTSGQSASAGGDGHTMDIDSAEESDGAGSVRATMVRFGLALPPPSMLSASKQYAISEYLRATYDDDHDDADDDDNGAAKKRARPSMSP